MGYKWDYKADGGEDGGGVGDVDEGGDVDDVDDGDDGDDVYDVDDGDDSNDGDDGVCMMTKCTEVVVSCLAGVWLQTIFSVIPSQVIGLEHRQRERAQSNNRENMAFIIPLQLSSELCSKNFPKQTNIGLACQGAVLPGILHHMNSHHW